MIRSLVVLVLSCSASLCTSSLAFAQAPSRAAVERAYLEGVEARIQPRWRSFLAELDARPPEARYRDPKLATVVKIVLFADGGLVRMEVEKASGLKGYDDATTDLLHDILPLPKPPIVLLSERDDRLYLRWSFDRKGDHGELMFDPLPVDEAVTRALARNQLEFASARMADAWTKEPALARRVLPRLADALLRQATVSADQRIRAAAAEVLGERDDGEEPLLKLAVDPVAQVRAAAMEALGARPRSQQARELLAKQLSGDQFAIAAKVLLRLGARELVVDAAKKLFNAGPAMRPRAIEMAAAAPDRALVPGLLAAIKDAPEPLRLQAIALLESSSKPASPDLQREIIRLALHDPTNAVRARAYTAMATLDDHTPGMRSRFVDALADADPRVRAAAAAGLVRVGGSVAADELIRASKDRAPEVRAALARALVAYPFNGSARVLKRLQEDGDPLVKAALAPQAEGTVAVVAAKPADPAVSIEALEGRVALESDPVRRLAAMAAWTRATRK